MGQAGSKPISTSIDTLELLLQVCDAADQVAAACCGKHAQAVHQQAAVLRAQQQQQWGSLHQQAGGLVGRHVFELAAALQALQAKLAWCVGKLGKGSAVSRRRQSSRRQAQHLLLMLTAAREACSHFHTTLQLAVLASQQQQQQQLESQPAVGTVCSRPAASFNSREREQPQQQQQPMGQLGERLDAQQPASPAEVDTAGTPMTSGSNGAGQPQSAAAPPAADMPGGTPAAAGANMAAAATAAAAEAQQGVVGAAREVQALLDDCVCGEQGWSDLLQQAWQGDVDAALTCAEQLMRGGDEDLLQARQLLRLAENQGCGTACLWLGQLAEQGSGGLPAPDYEQAARCFGSGAALGDPDCAQALAFYQEQGLGLTADIVAAREWYEFAAQQGQPAAQNNLARLLLKGAGGDPPDVPGAVHWLLAAAENGSTAACLNLGLCYEQGLQGGGPDDAAAAGWYERAGQQGSVRALLHLGALRQRQGRLADAKLALWEAAELGSAEAKLQLARLVAGQQLSCSGSTGGSSGSGAGGSLGGSSSRSIGGSLSQQAADSTALALCRQAAEAGMAEAQHVLGCTLWEQQPQDGVDGALQAWHAAAAQGWAPSLVCLARAAEQGAKGVQQDMRAARACYAMAAARGSREASLRLHQMQQELLLGPVHLS